MNPKEIILHHSLTKDSGTVSWDAIRRYHMDVKGWDDIGYHYGIELVGTHFEILIGRSMLDQGAHCYSHNEDSLGICFIGNYDFGSPPGGMWKLGIKHVSTLLRVFDLTSGNVKGHNEYDPSKTCPGRMFDMDRFRREVDEIL